MERFGELWVLDFEFSAPAGERPAPLCLVAIEARSGRTVRLWADAMRRLRAAPFDTGPSSVAVAFFASAEWSCFLELGWPMPVHVLDLYSEFRARTNGLRTVAGRSLLGAMTHFGLGTMAPAEKEEMRALALRGGPYTREEQDALLDYCEADVRGAIALLKAMEPGIDLPRALLRGRYTKAVARMERTGVPLDLPRLTRLRARWDEIKLDLISRIDAEYGVYEGTTFKADRWAAWCSRAGVPWPTLESGALALDGDTFRDMAKAYPAVTPIKELRSTLSELRLEDLAVGADGRNRCLLSYLGSRTGRNQPSNSRFIFGPSAWIRSLIRPEPGRALAYVDWSQQEFGIAAALSGDQRMIEAYRSGDPYLALAKMAGAAPSDATKASHKEVRDRFKTCSLGMLFGMGTTTLASRIGGSEAEARYLVEQHKRVFRSFWRWSQAACDHAILRGEIQSVFGWPLHVTDEARPTSLSNYPMQANGAEMLRLACCRATEEGVTIAAPVHDALLVEAAADEIDEVVTRTQEIMRWASGQVLSGFELVSDAELVVRYPDRYRDPSGRGAELWQTVTSFLDRGGSHR